VVLTVGALAWLWADTRSLNPEEHERVDSALRELRSLDRTINQDVLRARYQLIDGYDPVRRSYRRIEELEATLATPPSYLDRASAAALSAAVASYRQAVTGKQELIEAFKYRSADLKDLLGYLPGAGAGLAAAASEDDAEALASEVNRVLGQVLLYSLTSDEEVAPRLRTALAALSGKGEQARSVDVKRRVRTFVLKARSLLEVKHDVDALLRGIFDAPVVTHEEDVARTYYAGYASAERVSARSRVALCMLCVVLLVTVAQAIRGLQQTARALAVINERLEERVAERTRELDARNREMRAVLDNVDQALFTVDLAGRLSRERSTILERWFPNAKPGAQLWSVVQVADPLAAEWLTMGWDQLRDAVMPPEVIIDQLPRSLVHRGRHYQIGYRPIGDGANLEKVLLVVSDVTQSVEQAHRDAEQKEQLTMFQRFMRDRSGFLEFFGEAERLARAATAPELADEWETVLRAVHTLKGNCALFGATSVASVCHELETALVDAQRGLTADESARLLEAWDSFASRVRDVTGSAIKRVLDLPLSEIETLRGAILAGKRPQELLHTLVRWEREPTENRLYRLAAQARDMGRRLGKGEIVVETEAGDVRLDLRRWAPFWSSFVHLLRNAVDHGLETEDERVALGKPSHGQLSLRVRESGDDVIIEIADDGRGIDWEAVRAKGRALGLAVRSHEELIAVLFRGGVSTKATVTEFSGRGAGVSACYRECVELGGRVEVESKPGLGTTFRFIVPGDDVAAASLTSAA
jgi:HPt (histidine-containing phosphotransfer) domain-containing protein